MSRRPDLASFKQKALSDSSVRAEYEAMSAAFALKRQMISLRKKAGLTQEQMAELLGTKKSNISRLESVNSAVSPRLATVENYARALGYSIHVEFREGEIECRD